jgi:hypothetical protein
VAVASPAAAIRMKIGSPLRQGERERVQQTLETAQNRLTPENYASAWRDGRAATLDELLSA